MWTFKLLEIHISKERFILFGEKHGLLHQPTKNISETGFNAADHDVLMIKAFLGWRRWFSSNAVQESRMRKLMPVQWWLFYFFKPFPASSQLGIGPKSTCRKTLKAFSIKKIMEWHIISDKKKGIGGHGRRQRLDTHCLSDINITKDFRKWWQWRVEKRKKTNKEFFFSFN